jgi:hypothetical protein
MSSDNGHEHQHDTHYHGEPSRVLDDTPLPEAVFVYSTNSDESLTDEWLNQFAGVEELSRVYVSDPPTDTEWNLDIRTQRPDESRLFSTSFEGFSDEVLAEPSLLFVPDNLHLSTDAWTDMRANDVTVNWLSVDTNPQTDRKLPRLVVLSDWITKISREVPEARSTGMTQGVFHLNGDSLSEFNEICRKNQEIEEVFTQFLDGTGRKVRPAFLHERDWHLVD